MTGERALATEICEYGRRMYARGMVAASDGNISVRLGDGRFLTTPTGVSKGFMEPDGLCVIDARGLAAGGTSRPSTEVRMHLAIYRVRPDVAAVVHAHPPVATAFAVAGRPLDERLLAEVVVGLGAIPLAEFRLPSTDALADIVAQYIGTANAILMANHGAVTVGATLQEAFFRMETLEHFAQISLYSQLLGGPRPLDSRAVRELEELRRTTYGLGGAPVRAPAGTLGPDEVRRLVAEVVRRLAAGTGKES